MALIDRFWPRKKPAPQPRISPRNIAVISATRNFEAAIADRLTASWKSPSQTANEEIAAGLETTRNRSRDLFKNNEYASKFGKLVVANVVGSNGFTLQSQVVEGAQADTLARDLIEAAFKKWSRRGTCEVSGRFSFADVQRMVIETWARDGEALLLQLTGKAAGNAYGYALRLIEVERLPVQYTRDLAEGRRAIMGVEVNAHNKPVAYWLNLGKIETSAGGQSTLTRVDADQVLHVFKPYRPEQVRGMPAMHACISGLKMLDGYEEAAIVAARVGAAKMGFFTTPDGDGSPLGDDKDEQGNTITDADPGSFQALPPGMEFQSWSPEYPHANYQAFMKTRLRSIASGMGVTYHGLANDLEGVNFSSIRSGTLEERDAWMVLQDWFAEAFLRPVFGEWLSWSLMMGAIRYPAGAALPIEKAEKFSDHTWLGRRWGWVDPLKDIEAARLSIKTGIASPQMIAAQNGVDVADVLQAIADFEKQVADSGVTLVDYSDNQQTTITAPAGDPPAPPPAA